MVSEESKTRNVAGMVSNILHPYAVLTPVMAMITYQTSYSLETSSKWVVAALLPAYLLPLLYMQVRSTLVAHTSEAKVSFRSFFRERPVEMTFMACLFGIPSALILRSLDAPDVVMAAWIGLALTGLSVALANFRYRVSIHMALLTSMVTSVVTSCGFPFSLCGILIPILGISRYWLGAHTPQQLTAGLILGLTVTIAAFQGLKCG